MENFQDIHAKAIQWMVKRGWKRLWGKKGKFTQSLFQHTDIQLNVLGTLLPILAKKAHYSLTLEEQQTLIVGTIAHDVGKETKEWQEYVQLSKAEQQGKFVPHVIPSLTAKTVPDLVDYLGFNQAIVNNAINCVNLHMRATQTLTGTFGAIVIGDKRWQRSARIVEAIDKFCSIGELLPTLDYLRDKKDEGYISPYIRLSYHLVSLRGVSTTFLHQAARDVHLESGWLPLLHFSNGTIYVADNQANVAEPTASQILAQMAAAINETLPQEVMPKMVVGSPIASMIPKPDLFDYQELTQYLEEAAERIKIGSFKRKPEVARLKTIAEPKKGYWDLSHKPQEARNLDIDTMRIDRAQPFMMIFKFFRDAIKPELVGKRSGFADSIRLTELAAQRDETINLGGDVDKAQKVYEKAVSKLEKEGQAAFENHITLLYDERFGQGALARLQSTSTLMPARDMVAVIDPFWALPGQVLGLPYNRLEFVHDDILKKALIEALGEIAQTAYGSLPETLRPIRVDSLEMANSFATDLVYPINPQFDVQQMTQAQLTAYTYSKPEAMSKRITKRLCPVCNSYFEQGVAAKADFVNNPESHTNRGVSHGRTGAIVICNACKYERFLQQMLLGEKPARVMVLTPRMHIGAWSGQEFYRQVKGFYSKAQALMSNDTTNPNEQMTLTLTNMIYRNLAAENETQIQAVKDGLSGDTLAKMLTYSSSSDTKKKHLNELAKALRERYEIEGGTESIDQINEELNTQFNSWNEFAEAVAAKQVDDAGWPPDILDILVQIYNLYPKFKVICQTPNFVLMPMSERWIGNFGMGKESATNAALRELFILLLVGLALDCSVATIETGEPITFAGGEGIAKVPAVPTVRDLVGSEWVDLTQAPIWLDKIGAAALLADSTNYPERSNLYQILNAMTPGHVLRRIEMKGEYGANIKHINLIKKIFPEEGHYA